MEGRTWVARMAAALVACAAWLPGVAGAAPPTIEELLRRAEFDNIQISPTGEYLALTATMADRSVMVITRRADNSISTTLDPGHEGYIDDIAWVSGERVVVAWSQRIGELAQPYSMRALHTVDVNGRGKREFRGRVVDPMVRDPDRVLVLECYREVATGCLTRLSEVGLLKRGKPRHVVDGPVPNARFMVDRTGNPVFSWAETVDGDQLVFVRRDGEWVQVNDEEQSGVAVIPVAVGDDLRHGFLWRARRYGPDVIERIDPATGGCEVVAGDPGMDPSSLVLSFDLREAIGVRFGRGAPAMRYFDDSHPHVAMYRLLEAEFPGERVQVTSATRDGRLAVVLVTSDREPGRYYLLDIVSGDLRTLAEHRPWLDRRALATQRPVEFERRDGVRLDGYLTLPARPAAGGAPLVALVHGGPHGIRDAWGFDPEVQMLAAHGYAVLQVNFRGSAGRGREFMESGYRQWGRGMIDDIVDGVRWARRQPGVSPSPGCIWGASYGGYAALMASVREPDLFACAIGMAGPYDLPTMYRWGDTQRSRRGRARLEDYIGPDDAALLADSPSAHAGAIKAALFIAQGGRDHRVSPEHMRIMTRALDRAGKAYELYAPRNETHGFYDEANARAYYERVFAFLGRHLPAGTAAAAAETQPRAAGAE
ncbi:MAG: S9 family peptidase [Gammaproteobacteria bacterium]|nr:S9 family peptidase [Gammaproteobacteria bacterium]